MIKYQNSKHAIKFTEPSLTEQEHTESCDINKMIRDAHRGMTVRGGGTNRYGYDDTTMDAVQFRIQKQELEKNLGEYFENNEIDDAEEDALKGYAPSALKKFKIRKKKPVPPEPSKAAQTPVEPQG